MKRQLILPVIIFIFTACNTDSDFKQENWTDIDFYATDNEAGEETAQTDTDSAVTDGSQTDETITDTDEPADTDSGEDPDTDTDEVPDADADIFKGCANATCSDLGFCLVNDDTPECFCPSGYHSEFPDCVENNSASPCTGVECSGNGTCSVVDILNKPVL